MHTSCSRLAHQSLFCYSNTGSLHKPWTETPRTPGKMQNAFSRITLLESSLSPRPTSSSAVYTYVSNCGCGVLTECRAPRDRLAQRRRYLLCASSAASPAQDTFSAPARVLTWSQPVLCIPRMPGTCRWKKVRLIRSRFDTSEVFL